MKVHLVRFIIQFIMMHGQYNIKKGKLCSTGFTVTLKNQRVGAVPANTDNTVNTFMIKRTRSNL